MSHFLPQFLKFGVVGATNTLVYFAVYYVCVALDPAWYIVGHLAGWAVSVFNAWFWSRRYVFVNGRSSGGAQLVKSYVAYGSTAMLGTFLLWVVVEACGLSEWLAPWLTLVVTIPLNFLINKYWTFR